MNGKITISVSIAFAIVFSSLISLDYAFSDSEKKENFFFREKTQNKKILILGSSHVGILNSTLIEEMVTGKNADYSVYNLGYSNDKPKKRTEILHQMISLEPDFVFYGISYRDFGYHQYEDKFIPQKSMMKEKLLQIQGLEINPKMTTFKVIKSIFENNNLSDNSNKDFVGQKTINHANAPFFPIQSYYTNLATQSDLRRDGNVFIASQIYIEPQQNNQLENFRTILHEFQKNDIQVVLFTIPHHKLYLDSITPETKQTFEEFLKEVVNEFNVEIYDFQKNYTNFPYWYDVEHVAYVPEAMDYSRDIANMINQEIEP